MSISLPPFLQKLRLIASTCPAGVAGWGRDGTIFEVRDDGEFESAVLSKHFKGSLAVSTFVRQLNYYCFKKIDIGEGKWAFAHPKFLRDMPHLIFEITRRTRTAAPVPASKDEVQALRSEVAKVHSEVAKLREVVLATQAHQLQQAQLLQLLVGGAANPAAPAMLHPNALVGPATAHVPPASSSSAAAATAAAAAAAAADADSDLEASASAGAGACKRRKTMGTRSASIEAFDPAFAALPLEEGPGSGSGSSSSGQRQPEQHVSLLFDDDNLGDLAKVGKELGPLFDSTEIEYLSDLFLGVDPVLDGASSESGSGTVEAASVAAGPLGASRATLASAASLGRAAATESDGDKAVIWLHNSRTQRSRLSMAAFAGLFSSFIRHATLLHSHGQLHEELDAELEVFVHQTLPQGSPLKNVLAFSAPCVRTVLMNVLSEENVQEWGGDPGEPGDISEPSRLGDSAQEQTKLAADDVKTTGGEFLERPFIVMCHGTSSLKPLDGKAFVLILSCLLKAAVNYVPTEAVPSVQQEEWRANPFLREVSRHFSPEAQRILAFTHAKIAEIHELEAARATESGPHAADASAKTDGDAVALP